MALNKGERMGNVLRSAISIVLVGMAAISIVVYMCRRPFLKEG